MHQSVKEEIPTWSQAIAFGIKAGCFRAKRTIQNLKGKLRRFPQEAVNGEWPVIAESRTLLYSSQSGSEFGLQAGKVHNLRIAARYLNGIYVDAGAVFSFWKHVPRPTRWRGFSSGRELREGCIIPSIGGGLCQISNALYDCALKAGLEVVERHGHSRTLPGSMAAVGRDATIFWNYVDLRFRSESSFQIEALLGRGELVVRFRSKDFSSVSLTDPTPDPKIPAGDLVESCETCGVTSCFRHPATLQLSTSSTTAWLVDAFWPEHDQYLAQNTRESDWLFSPAPSGNYRWNKNGFARVLHSRWLVLRRSIASRRLAQQGAIRQRTLLEFDKKLAESYARRIPPSALHLVVSQNLLPFLWHSGALGGRTFDVLMTRLPLGNLQATLDEAAQRWPESSTLSDFRADADLLKDEAAALAEADHWITPHSQVAMLAGEKAIQLNWQIPSGAKPEAGGPRILFPASTLGRKGAWELRETGLPVTISGPVLEAVGFWGGVDADQRAFSLEGVSVVVQPAWVENQPRRLLQAVSAGVPVIASEACGLSGVDGVTVIRAGDTEGLKAALENFQAPKDRLD